MSGWKKPPNGGSGGSSVSPSVINGKIMVNNQDISVYNDTEIRNTLQTKADIIHQHNISEITDIDATNKTNGYTLQYDILVEKFVSKPLPVGTGSGATNLDGLSDVDVTTKAPTEGSALTYQSGVWKPGTITATGYQANAEIPLFIETYTGGENLPIHCKIVKFTSAWNGYKYWMAYTPWPDDINENPSIAASNDLLNWETPSGVNNPIAPRNPAWDAFTYYSDTDLIYNPDTGKLECWYRWNQTNPAKERIYRRTSSDGRNWSAEETLAINESSGSLVYYVAPSVIYENGKYRIWVGYDRSVIKYYESTTGTDWQFIANVVGTYDWHFKLERTDKGIEYLGGGNTALNHAISQDGITFTNRQKIMGIGNVGNFDDTFIYLACMVKVGKKYYVFYTGRGAATKSKGIGLTISTVDDDITSIRGLNAGSYIQMAKPKTSGTVSQRPTNTAQIGTVYFDTQIGKPIWKKNATTWVDANGTVV